MSLFNYSAIYHQAKTFHNLNLQDSSKRMDQNTQLQTKWNNVLPCVSAHRETFS